MLTLGVSLHLLEHNPFLLEHSLKSHPSPSSAPFGQSSLPSHTEVMFTHRSVTSGHCHCSLKHRKGGLPQAWSSPSSELSPQSSFPSQIYALNTHWLFLHLTKLGAQSCWPQLSGSSEWSSQSGVPSQCQVLGMQIPDATHWNCFSLLHWSGAIDAGKIIVQWHSYNR